ncbi:MAG TPA: ATP-binding protein [Bacteroidales bacterium]|nr:ATP-binding protein [Bacteroidales bacterium]
MGFNRFSAVIVFRIILIVLNTLLLVYIIKIPERFFTAAALTIIIIIQIGSLLYYVNKTNRQLARFLLSMKSGDTSVKFSSAYTEKMFRGLTRSFDDIIAEIQLNRLETGSRLNYYLDLLENINTGIISIDEKGYIDLFNKSARRYLGTGCIRSLNMLEQKQSEVVKVMKELKPGETRTVRIISNGEMLQLLVEASLVKMMNKRIRIISLQDIRNELEEKELESWQKLIRVLTHEIMNNITPLTTLAATIRNIMKGGDSEEVKGVLTTEDVEDIRMSATLIEERSRGLASFIQHYRDLTRLPAPSFEKINVGLLFQNIKLLLKEQIEQQGVTLQWKTDSEDLTIVADEKLIRMVLVNLIKNAAEALESTLNPMILMDAYRENEKTVLKISDNGPGVPKEMHEKIFIPFFTTKEKGSGIGLSFSRQVMRLHHGKLNFYSGEDKGAVFVLEF